MLRSAASKVMWVGRATVFLVGSAVMLALVFGVAATALGATGGNFILGQSNSANKQTTLVGSVADVAKSALRVDNNGGGPALHLRVGSAETPANDIAPMKVNSSKKVDNLNADSLDGNSSEAFFRYDSTIPPGTTITGAFGGGEQDTTDPPPASYAPSVTYQQVVSFPIPAPADLTNSTVNFAPGEIAADDDPACTGTADNPTAPPGKVCIYASGLLGSITHNSAEGQAIAFTDTPRGFIVKFSGTGGSQNGPVVFGTWAYTAP